MSEYDDAVEVLAAYAATSAAELRRLLRGMAPNVARRVAQIASQLEVAADLEVSRPTQQPPKNRGARKKDGVRGPEGVLVSRHAPSPLLPTTPSSREATPHD